MSQECDERGFDTAFERVATVRIRGIEPSRTVRIEVTSFCVEQMKSPPMSENYPNGPAVPLTDLSKRTKEFYAMKAAAEMRRYERETGHVSWEDDPMDFVGFFLRRRSKVKSNTWRLLRAAVRYALVEHHASRAVMDYLEESVGQPPTVPGVTATEERLLRKAARKAFPRSALDAITQLLEGDAGGANGGGAYDTFLAAWLRANIEIGLRPAEWEHLEARIVDGKHTLMVRNAKATHGRGNGTYRLLSVTPFTYQLVTRAMEQRDTLLEFGLRWEDLQEKMRTRLYTVRQSVSNARHVSLYSTRHQAVADSKSSGKTPREIADQFGHNSDETAARHYGKRRAGRGVSTVLQAEGVESVNARPSSSPSQSPGQTTTSNATSKPPGDQFVR